MAAVVGRPAPSLRGLDGWQQSPPRSLTQHRGQVVLVWFFTVSSPACMGMVRGLRRLQATHGEDLMIIGVHSPQFARDTDPRDLGRRIALAGMAWPVAMDHRRTVFARWQEGADPQGWPCSYVLDRTGGVAAISTSTDAAQVAALVGRVIGDPPVR